MFCVIVVLLTRRNFLNILSTTRRQLWRFLSRPLLHPVKELMPPNSDKVTDAMNKIKVDHKDDVETREQHENTNIHTKTMDSSKGPTFWSPRLELFKTLFAKQELEYKQKERPITVELVGVSFTETGNESEQDVPHVVQLTGTAYCTTPFDLLEYYKDRVPRSALKKATENFIVAKVDDAVWDLTRPLERDCTVELLDWESGSEAQYVFWHSSAHVLGYALEQVLECKLSVGPPLAEGGFFYEGDVKRPITDQDYPSLEKSVRAIVQGTHPFQRLVLTKENAIAMFGYNPFKSTILSSKVQDGAHCVVYRCGNLIDPCRGPHLPHTGRVRSFCVTKNSSSYFQGNVENASLQRVYAMSFPKESLMKEWKARVADAALYDHRVLGKKQELWNWNSDLSPGSTFWHPYGARIYLALVDFMRKQYRRRGFEEVITPNMYHTKLWQISGHYDKYKENLFFCNDGCKAASENESAAYALKPMNCPGHCLLYKMRPRSYRELPMRLADFGVLHRNEISGALSGLTRVRRFQQDDAHIFCTEGQLGKEIRAALTFLRDVYEILGFTFSLALATRPKLYLGEVEAVESQRKTTCEKRSTSFAGFPRHCQIQTRRGHNFNTMAPPTPTGSYESWSPTGQTSAVVRTWELHPEDGAFYGPKIDLCVTDALGRKHQLGTLQLDFQLPLRFNLTYVCASPNTVVSNENGEGGQTTNSDMSTPTNPANETRVVEETKETKEEVKESHSLERPLDASHKRPVMIHRAIFGSLERCVAILAEHYRGKWPFWISPRQILVVPVSNATYTYAQEIKDIFHAEFHADVDLSEIKMEKKIRNGQMAQYNFIFVVGAQEEANRTVNVRTRDNVRHGCYGIDEMEHKLSEIARTFAKNDAITISK